MKNKYVLFILLLLFVSPLFGQVNKIGDQKEVMGKIQLAEIWINELMDYYEIPGLALGIVYDDQLIYSKGFGYANLETKKPATDKTLFRIASITKLFTGTAIMQLRDQGKLLLNDPVKKFLPWFNLKNPFDNTPEVTIWHILTHTGGIPREAAFPYWTDHIFPTTEQIKETVSNQSMIFEPETHWKYSNLGIVLLGEIVEAVSGTNYDDYIINNIFKPLGMDFSKIQIAENDPDLAVGYLHAEVDGKRVVAPFVDSKGITPAANISSSVEDLAKFCSLQFSEDKNEEGQILKGTTLREMHRIQWLQPSWSGGWGLAFSISKDNDKKMIGHGGWVGGYRSQLLFNTDDKAGVIVFINTEDYSPNTIASRIYKLVADPLKAALGESKEDYKLDPAWERYVGKYVDPTFWYTHVVILNEKLYLYGYGYPPSENPENNLTLLYPESENTFRMKDGNGELVRFELDSVGKVIKLWSGENYSIPVKTN